MGRKTLPITLTPEQHALLRTIEHDPNLPRQTRLRAQIVRLAAQGVDRAQLAAYTGYHPQTLPRILRRFRQHGVDGLHERPRPERQPKWTPHATALLHACLQQSRTWTCTHLQQTLPHRRRLVSGVPRRLQKGAHAGQLGLWYLDETGLGLSAPPTATWRPSGQPWRVPKATGKRVPWQVMGTLAWCGERVWREYRWGQGRMDGAQVVDFLDALAEQTVPDCPTVAVLENASFYPCRAVQVRWGAWARRGVWCLSLPA